MSCIFVRSEIFQTTLAQVETLDLLILSIQYVVREELRGDVCENLDETRYAVSCSVWLHFLLFLFHFILSHSGHVSGDNCRYQVHERNK